MPTKSTTHENDPIETILARIEEIRTGKLNQSERHLKLFFASGYALALYDAGVISEDRWRQLDHAMSEAESAAHGRTYLCGSPLARPVVTAELMLPVLRKEPFLVGVIEPDLVPDVADGFARVWPLGAGELANIVRSKARGVWNPSHDDVLESALEGVVGAVDELLRLSCWEWAVENNIRPPLLVGTVIEQGTIDGICEQFAATYRVRQPAVEPSLLQTYQLVAFEDAKPV